MPDTSATAAITRRLFYASERQLQILVARSGELFEKADQLRDFEMPGLDKAGLAHLRELVRGALDTTDARDFFESEDVEQMTACFASGGVEELGSGDDTVEFQLAILTCRIVGDFIKAHEFFEEHHEGLNRLASRIMVRNEVTGEVNWSAAQDAMTTLLERNFKERYVGFGRVGDSYRKTRQANEALFIAAWIIECAQENSPISSGHSAGIGFEKVCGQTLEAVGYEVEYTAISGDFGCDLLANRDGLRYAVQCKSGITVAGVGAVQEALAGQSHYTTDYAVVVAESGHTQAAKELAASSRVILLKPELLCDMAVLARSVE